MIFLCALALFLQNFVRTTDCMPMGPGLLDSYFNHGYPHPGGFESLLGADRDDSSLIPAYRNVALPSSEDETLSHDAYAVNPMPLLNNNWYQEPVTWRAQPLPAENTAPQVRGFQTSAGFVPIRPSRLAPVPPASAADNNNLQQSMAGNLKHDASPVETKSPKRSRLTEINKPFTSFMEAQRIEEAKERKRRAEELARLQDYQERDEEMRRYFDAERNGYFGKPSSDPFKEMRANFERNHIPFGYTLGAPTPFAAYHLQNSVFSDDTPSVPYTHQQQRQIDQPNANTYLNEALQGTSPGLVADNYLAPPVPATEGAMDVPKYQKWGWDTSYMEDDDSKLLGTSDQSTGSAVNFRR